MSADAAACVFCRIVAGNKPDQPLVYEDDHTAAFIDPRQVTPGHTLVVPKAHVRDLFEHDDVSAAALLPAVARIARAVRSAFGCEGISLWQQNGAAAGQEVFHLHIHVMPRHAGDGLLRIYPTLPNFPSADERAEMGRRLRAELDPSPRSG